MSKKIVIVGPPGVGKTTLRKIFFEGENSLKLLENSLEPTHGLESIVLNLGEDIGVFDLAGQENERWFGTEDKSIFQDVQIIINVFEITSSIIEIREFVEKVVEIRNTLSTSAYIYVIIHKIDLVDGRVVDDIKYQLNKTIANMNKIQVFFTSISPKYFLNTLTIFLEILKTSLSDEIVSDKMNLELIKNVIEFLNQTEREVVISRKQLMKELNVSMEEFGVIFNFLNGMKFLEQSTINNEQVYSLTEYGKKYFKGIMEHFSLEGLVLREETIEERTNKEELHPFFGIIIADMNGKSCLTSEIFEGAFESILGGKTSESADLDLIPMFISALEKFSSELNIKNLPGFKLKGTNVVIKTIIYEVYTITLFISPNTNTKSIKNELNEKLIQLINSNKNIFTDCIETGLIHGLELNAKGKDLLSEINALYKEKVINLEIFDFESATNLFKQLEDISSEINLEYSIFLEKVKKLKISLMKAILDEDYQKIREIGQKIEEIKI